MRLLSDAPLTALGIVTLGLMVACGGDDALDGGTDAGPLDARTTDAAQDVTRVDVGDVGAEGVDAGPGDMDAGPGDAGAPCMTRVSYGASWIGPADHPGFDDVAGEVTWDGVCGFDGTNSFAELSNGWRPFFRGRSACIVGIDQSGACESTPPACRTRVTYGDAWLHGDGHPAQFDEVGGVVTWEGTCRRSGSQSFARLSNGWEPHFSGTNACDVWLRHEQCGGLYANPVLPQDCPDPGVVKDGERYVMVCTGGGGGNAYPIRTSRDLVHWTSRGWIFPAGSRPTWATDSFWAPEIHRVREGLWVAYFSARNRDGALSVGAATADNALGPFTDIGHPLVNDPNPGVIDAHYFQASDGRRFVTWKVDGNAVGRATPIRIREVADDGVTFMGAASTILTNDRGWEGALVEGQWMFERGGFFYLFYSANGYASANYAVGVARSSSPLGPFTKAAEPILTSNGEWGGPGHGSVVAGPSGDTVHVYHSWERNHIGEAPGRLVLVDRIDWRDGWPHMDGAPSRRSSPMP